MKTFILKFSLLKLSREEKMKYLERVNYKGFIWPLVMGIVLWLITPWRPSGLTPQAWEMFAIFVATIVGCITKPLPIGGTTLLGMAVTVLVGIAPVKDGVNSKGVSFKLVF